MRKTKQPNSFFQIKFCSVMFRPRNFQVTSLLKIKKFV
ncbi:MAG: hypothetical protein AVDCRST_MAG74-2604 [uncultured Pyrinomonadaceae bacterium]|uniref:Uncharacterized protein n=1 Tax=uncultured Pyrinomonadaceae bacterium TaxID=2283094 RepID=A0A6J4PP77_9BACT|nr:MAG: hypothetical protein AVDCRST_MAG74-2604 [uncultured Pyrinomonadaceae bacterium]